MVLYAGVFERHGEKPIKTFTLAFVQSGDTRDELYETFVYNSMTDLKSEIRRLYVLAGMVRPAGRYRAVVDIGEDLGLERGGILWTGSHGDQAGRKSGTFLHVEETFPRHSNTRIVRQWGTREAGEIARELVDGVVEFRIFIGRHLLRTPRSRVALLSALHLDAVLRIDSESRFVIAFIPGVSVALESSVVVAARWDAVVATGYRLSPTVNNRMIAEEAGVDDFSARFNNRQPSCGFW